MSRLLIVCVAAVSLCGCLEFSPTGHYKCDPASNQDCVADAGGGGGAGDGGGNTDAGADGGGGSDAGQDAGEDGGEDGGVDPNLVVVHRSVTWIRQDGGTSNAALGPDDPGTLLNAPSTFWTLESDGQLAPLTPTDLGDGRFTLPVPPGEAYVVRRYNTFIFTRARELDLGTDEYGHPGILESDGGTVFLTANGIISPSSSDQYQLASPDTGESGQLIPKGVPPPGSTSYLQEPVDYQSSWNLSVSAAAGDRIHVSQHKIFQIPELPGSPTSCRTTAATFLAQPTDLNLGGVTNLQGNFSRVSPTSRTVTVDSAGVLAAATEVSPTANFNYVIFFVSPVAVPQSWGWVGYLGEELRCLIFSNPNGLPTQVTLQHGVMPFRQWAMGSAQLGYRYTLHVNPTVIAYGFASFTLWRPEEELFKSGVQIFLRPPQSATVDGVSFRATGPTTLSSATPTVSWQAPTPGPYPVTSYRLRIYEIYSDPTGSWRTREVANVTTTEQQVRVPAGVLTSGKPYTFVVFAESGSGGRYSVDAPMRNPEHYLIAPAASDVFIAP